MFEIVYVFLWDLILTRKTGLVSWYHLFGSGGVRVLSIQSKRRAKISSFLCNKHFINRHHFIRVVQIILVHSKNKKQQISGVESVQNFKVLRLCNSWEGYLLTNQVLMILFWHKKFVTFFDSLSKIQLLKYIRDGIEHSEITVGNLHSQV